MSLSRQLSQDCDPSPAKKGTATITIINFSDPSTVNIGVGIYQGTTSIAATVYHDVLPNSSYDFVFPNIPNGNYTANITSPISENLPFTLNCNNIPCDLVLNYVSIEADVNAQGVGKITVGATSSFPKSYSLDGVTYQSSNIFSNVHSGNYTVYVKDTNPACSVVTSPVTVDNTPCQLVIDSFSKTDETGTDLNDGTANISAYGASPGIQFSLDGGLFQVSGSFTGIAPGVHSITIKDSSNCTQFQNFTIAEFPDVPSIPTECFNPSLVISDSLPYRFVLKHCNQLDNLEKLYWENDLCGVYQPCYYQPLKCSDVLTLQIYYLEEEFKTVPKLVILGDTGVLYTLPFTSIGGGYYQLIKNVSELPLICNKIVYFEIKSYLPFNDTIYFTHARSELIKVSNNLDCNILLKYWNDADFNEIKYEGTGYINYLRLEAIFDLEDLPQEIESYTKSNGYIVPLSETIKEIWNIDVSFIPVYLHKIITVALSHQHIQIEGYEYVKEEPYTFERIPKYSLRRGTGKLSKKTYQSKNLIY